MTGPDTDTHRAIDAVWRIESPKIVAALTRMTRDVGVAEDLAHDALVAALEQWPGSGVPRNPGAWLMAIGKRRAIDLLRRRARFDRKLKVLGHELDTGGEGAASEFDAALEEEQDIDDDL